MTDQQEENHKFFALKVCGRTVMQFKVHEHAEEWLKAIREDPVAFTQVEEQPIPADYLYKHFKFDD